MCGARMQGSRVAGAALLLWLLDVSLPPREGLRARAVAPLRHALWRSWRRYHRRVHPRGAAGRAAPRAARRARCAVRARAARASRARSPPALTRQQPAHDMRLSHSFSIVGETQLDPAGVYVYAAHPHGVFPMCVARRARQSAKQHARACATDSCTLTQPSPRARRAQWLCLPASCDAAADATDAAVLRALGPTSLRGAVASCLLRLPLLRHLLTAAGLVPASAAMVRRLLHARTSVVLIPGGIAEIFVSRPHEEVLVLRSRKGFARAALEAGVPLVPVYCFGNTGVFRVAPTPPALARLSRRLRVGIFSFWGRWGLPLPHRCRLRVAVGPPVVPRPGESVDSLHARYCEALRALFDRHKASMGPDWAAKQLTIT
jgi:1-acyl-sn-glycerol-3-phosphate acyltransferase